MRPLLSVRQAAKFLGVCHATAYRLCVRGMPPQFRVSNAIRIDTADLKAFLGQAGRGIVVGAARTEHSHEASPSI
jgi:excisionase family DNA binding protein